MPIEIQCPECGETLTLSKAADKSKRLRCPDCDHAFRLPGKKPAGKARAAPAGGMPPWAPYAIGGGVVAVLAVVLVLALGGKDKPQAAAPKPNDPQPVVPQQPVPPRPDPRPVDPPQPVPGPDPEPEPVNPPQPDPVPPRPPVVPRPLPPRVELPPLPPPDQRPGLVLDPGNHTAQVRQVAFTPDGKRFVTVSGDKTVRVWDTATGTTVRIITMPKGSGRDGSLSAAAVSPDGKSVAVGGDPLVSAGKDTFSFLISLESGEVVRTFGGHGGTVTGVDFSFDGKLLVSCSADTTARVYRVATGELVGVLKGHQNVVSRVRFQPKGLKIATASVDGTARVWTPQGQGYSSVVLAAEPKSERLDAVLWGLDGKTVIAGGGEGIVRVWSDTGKPIRAYPQYEASAPGRPKARVNITGMALTRDGKDVVLGGVAYLGNSALLNLATGEFRVDRVGAHSNTVTAVSASPKEDLAVTIGGEANEIQVWRTADGSAVHDIHGGAKGIWAVKGARQPGVLIYGDVNSGTALPLTRPLTAAFDVGKLDFAPMPQVTDQVPAQERLGGNEVRLADFYTVEVTRGGQPLLRYSLPEATHERIYSATLLPRQRLIVGTAFNMRMIDLTTQKVVRTYRGHTGIVTTVAPTPDGMLVTGCSDQTVRVYHPDRDDPVLSLFFVGREWIAWTPEGYYAASAGGERLMGWQVNNGDKKVASYFSAVQFRQTLYQPAVIRSLFEAKGDLGLAIAIAVRDTKRPVPAVSVSQVLPPAVAITSPKAADDVEVKSDKDTLQVTATATGTAKHPVRAMRLLVDGRPYQGAQGLKAVADPKGGDATATWAVTLPPGKHTLIVQADNGASKGLSPAVDVAQAGDDTALPSLYVCAIGVNAYPGNMKLNFAASDARAMTGVLESKTGGVFGKVQVKLMTDRDATKGGILSGLDWLKSVMTPRDVGLFFFSGHGMSAEDGTFYLVPVDIDPRDPVGTCLPGEVVKQKLTDMPGRLVAVFDACHSGAAATSLQPGGADGLARELLTDDCGVVVLCSSMGHEVSLESTATKAGFFTFGLLEGLNGKADLNRDGVVYIHEATAYAVLRVKQLSQGTQNPTLGRSPHLRPFPLTKK